MVFFFITHTFQETIHSLNTYSVGRTHLHAHPHSLNQMLLLTLAASCQLPVPNDPKSKDPKAEFPPIWICSFLEQNFSNPPFCKVQKQKELSSQCLHLPLSLSWESIPPLPPIRCSFSTPKLATNSKIPLIEKFQVPLPWLGWECILLTSQLFLPVTSSASTSKQLPHCTFIVLPSRRTETRSNLENYSEP